MNIRSSRRIKVGDSVFGNFAKDQPQSKHTCNPPIYLIDINDPKADLAHEFMYLDDLYAYHRCQMENYFKSIFTQLKHRGISKIALDDVPTLETNYPKFRITSDCSSIQTMWLDKTPKQFFPCQKTTLIEFTQDDESCALLNNAIELGHKINDGFLKKALYCSEITKTSNEVIDRVISNTFIVLQKQIKEAQKKVEKLVNTFFHLRKTFENKHKPNFIASEEEPFINSLLKKYKSFLCRDPFAHIGILIADAKTKVDYQTTIDQLVVYEYSYPSESYWITQLIASLQSRISSFSDLEATRQDLIRISDLDYNTIRKIINFRERLFSNMSTIVNNKKTKLSRLEDDITSKYDSILKGIDTEINRLQHQWNRIDNQFMKREAKRNAKLKEQISIKKQYRDSLNSICRNNELLMKYNILRKLDIKQK